MNVEELKYFGKDILTISEESQMPLGQKLSLLGPVLSYLGSVIRALGLKGTVQLVRGVKEEIASAESID
ncbi:MAG: hypothetical protein K8R77_07425, partial [Anaerolineaceae bacterium]|nr:hypothetical protein [Anaerolineaceae bacterium]